MAQILEKKGIMQLSQASAVNKFYSLPFIFKAVSNLYLMAGISLAMMGFVCWLGTLSQFNISYIYSFGAISYILIAVLGNIMLGEHISTTRWIGIAIIVIGCAIINLDGR